MSRLIPELDSMNYLSYHIAKAQGEEISPVIIRIDREMPEIRTGDWMRLCAEFYDAQGVAIVEALSRSLPGGTLDRVLFRLFEKRLLLLRIPLFDSICKCGHKQKEHKEEGIATCNWSMCVCPGFELAI